MVIEVDANRQPVVEYTYYPGIDTPHSMRRGGATYYYAQDAQSNLTGLVSSTGTLSATYEYTPFGETITASGTPVNVYRFKGREYDAESGLYFMRARYYDPQLGRFNSEDPIGIAGGINTYAFGGNDPVNYRDPSGLARECIQWWTRGHRVISAFGDTHTPGYWSRVCWNTDLGGWGEGWGEGWGGGGGTPQQQGQTAPLDKHKVCTDPVFDMYLRDKMLLGLLDALVKRTNNREWATTVTIPQPGLYTLYTYPGPYTPPGRRGNVDAKVYPFMHAVLHSHIIGGMVSFADYRTAQNLPTVVMSISPRRPGRVDSVGISLPDSSWTACPRQSLP